MNANRLHAKRLCATGARRLRTDVCLPKIGQEVVVSFLGGDIDRPLCTGRIYNQNNQPPWKLPEQQALSGIRSRELKPGGGNSAAGRSNHLILDDTDNKIQAQLKSDHDHSSLSLGHITRIEDHQGRKDPRGEGFELRTDGHGAIRAKDGLLISTEGRAAASAHITDMGETSARLSQGQGQHEALGALASQHQAQTPGDQDAVAQALKQQNQDIAGKPKQGPAGQGEEGQFPELQAPHLALTSPAGIQSTTPGSTHQHSGEHHAITSGGHTSLSAGKSWLVSVQQAIKLFAYHTGIKLISARKDFDIRALKTNIDMLAKMQINATAQGIEITGTEEVLINGGGSDTRWSASGVERGTSGSHTLHAASHSMAGPKSLPVAMPPLNPVKQWLELKYTYPDMKPVVGAPYRVLFANGEVREGTLDDKGFARLENVPDTQAFVEYGEDSRDATPRQATAPNGVLGMSVTDTGSAQRVRDKYLAQEEEHLLDNYFPDEIDALLNPNDYETLQYWGDYAYTNELDAEGQGDYASKHQENEQGDKA